MKTFSFELNSKRYVVEYVERQGFRLFYEVEGQWKGVAGYKAGALRGPDIEQLVTDVFEGRFEEEHPGALLRAMVGFRSDEESPSFKSPRFTEVTDPRLIEALAKLQALCRAEGISITGDFSVWVGDVGYDQLDHLSGREQTHWKRSRGQVKA